MNNSKFPSRSASEASLRRRPASRARASDSPFHAALFLDLLPIHQLQKLRIVQTAVPQLSAIPMLPARRVTDAQTRAHRNLIREFPHRGRDLLLVKLVKRFPVAPTRGAISSHVAHKWR